MYIIPRKYVCKKCGFEMEWTPDYHERTPRVVIDKRVVPVCPECWNRWIAENVSAMEAKQ